MSTRSFSSGPRDLICLRLPALLPLSLLVFAVCIFTANASAAPSVSCSVLAAHPPSEAEKAYLDGKYDEAATLYQQQLQQKPGEPSLTSELAQTLLHQTKIKEADDLVQQALAHNSNSVVLQTSLAMVQYREGLPWAASTTASQAMKIDPCYPQLRLLNARILRLNSMYASAAREIAVAHALDPHDPEIRLQWLQTLPPTQRISELGSYLAAANGDDAEQLRNLRSYLDELKTTVAHPPGACRLVSSATTTSIPFERLMGGAKEIRAFALDVKIDDHNTRLEIDTGASGLTVSQSVAERAGLKKISEGLTGGIGDKGGAASYSAYADDIKIGALEFRDCEVDVIEGRNIVGSEGLIGMDVLSRFLVTLDFPMRQLILGPLPPRPGDNEVGSPSLETAGLIEPGDAGQPTAPAQLPSAQSSASAAPARPPGPRDRYVAPEMKTWTPVYRVGHNLIMPAWLNDNRPRLFILDTGAFTTSITPQVASEVTKVRAQDEVTVKGISGEVKQVYFADKVVFKFGGLSHENLDVVTFDSPGIDNYAGMQIAGFIGFSTLAQTTVKIDYRDALVNFSYVKGRGYQDEQDPD